MAKKYIDLNKLYQGFKHLKVQRLQKWVMQGVQNKKQME